MSVRAWFDADGVCMAVGTTGPRKPRQGAVAEVADGTRPDSVWWNGAQVAASEPLALDLPETLALGEACIHPLPPGTVAMVNGQRSRGELTIPTGQPGKVFVEWRGARHGSAVVEVRDYAAARRAEYPSLADQLDAFWKGGAEVEAMRARVLAVKDRHPKAPPLNSGSDKE